MKQVREVLMHYGFRPPIHVLRDLRSTGFQGDSLIDGLRYCDAVATPPERPINLQISHISESSIRVNWTDASTNEVGFTVSRQQKGGQWEIVHRINEQFPGSNKRVTWKDTGLSPNTEYCYRVKAFNRWGESVDSETKCARTDPTEPRRPDIVASGVYYRYYGAPGKLYAYQRFDMVVVFSNQGNEPSGPFRMQVQDESGATRVFDWNEQLDPGEVREWILTFQYGYPPGNHALLVKLDVEDVLIELSESNNNVFSSFIVYAA